MVTHTEPRCLVNSHGIVPVSPRYCSHGKLFLTVQEGEIRAETDLNLPQNLEICILSNTKTYNLTIQQTVSWHLKRSLNTGTPDTKKAFLRSRTMQNTNSKLWFHYLNEIRCLYLWRMDTLDLRFDAVEVLDDSFNLWKLKTQTH